MRTAAKVLNPPLVSDAARRTKVLKGLEPALCLWLSQGCLVLGHPGPWFSPRSGITLPPDGVRD